MGRFQPTRAFYIPEGATEQKHDDLGVVLYLYDSNKGAPAAMCFTGRAQKPTWCYRFKDADHRATYIAETLDARRIALDLKAKARAEAHQPCTLTPDDILVSSWGYEQTNVDFLPRPRDEGQTRCDCSTGWSHISVPTRWEHVGLCGAKYSHHVVRSYAISHAQWQSDYDQQLSKRIGLGR